MVTFLYVNTMAYTDKRLDYGLLWCREIVVALTGFEFLVRLAWRLTRRPQRPRQDQQSARIQQNARARGWRCEAPYSRHRRIRRDFLCAVARPENRALHRAGRERRDR